MKEFRIIVANLLSSFWCGMAVKRVEKIKELDVFCKVEIWKKKEEIWLSPMAKAPIPTEMSKGQSDNTNNAT